jgi:HNH endonuclease
VGATLKILKLKRHPSCPEIWVSSHGRVFRELTPTLDSAGYHQIRNGTFRLRRHVLVAETWVGLRPPGFVVRHKDGNPGNDHPDNLEWGTQADGSKNAHAKLTEAQAKEIKQRRASGESGRSLAKEFGVSQSTICDIHKGRCWSWL